MSRDVLAAIAAYNAPLRTRTVPRADGKGDLTVVALRQKLDALAEDPFRFLRGTFHLMAAELPDSKAPRGLVVGDVHLENFGVYRGRSGELCFDVNDFDDVGTGPLDLDVTRLCTSALLLAEAPAKARIAAAAAAAHGWADEIAKHGARFPIPPFGEDKASGVVRKLLEGKHQKSRADLLAKSCAKDALLELEGKQVHVGKAREAEARQAAARYFDALRALKASDVPKDPDVLDVAYRFKGTGSLGRLRYTVLVADGSERRLFELKEARASVMEAEEGANRGAVQVAAIRRLQADPWPRAAATAFGRDEALGRELEPEEEKVTRAAFAKNEGVLEEYALQCGQVLGRMHARVNAPALLRSGWDVKKAAHAALESAERYAARVEDDHRTFVRGREQVAAALGLDAGAA